MDRKVNPQTRPFFCLMDGSSVGTNQAAIKTSHIYKEYMGLIEYKTKSFRVLVIILTK